MSKVSGIDLHQMSEANRMRILYLVHENQGISRTNLARITDLSLSAVSRIVSHLVEAGFLTETGYGDSGGGRKPVIVEPNPEAGYVIGVDFGRTKAKAALLNFCGQIIYQIEANVPHDDYLQGLYMAIDSCIAYLPEDQVIKIMGIGVGVRGLIDSKNGTIMSSKSFRWQNIPLRQLLEERYHIPTFLDINARLAALAEWKLTYGKKFSDLFYITVTWGIGAGIILNGEIYGGSSGTAGELGENLIQVNNLARPEWKTLEGLCAGQALIEKARIQWHQPENVKLKEYTNNSPEKLMVEDIIRGVKEGDSFCKRLVKEAGTILGMGLVNVVNSFDPQIIVIGGLLSETGETLLEPIRTAIDGWLPIELKRKVKIEISALGEHASVIGASLLVFERAFSIPNNLENVNGLIKFR